MLKIFGRSGKSSSREDGDDNCDAASSLKRAAEVEEAAVTTEAVVLNCISGVYALTWTQSPNSEHTLRLYDAMTAVQLWSATSGVVRKVMYSPSVNKLFAAGDSGNSITVWNTMSNTTNSFRLDCNCDTFAVSNDGVKLWARSNISTTVWNTDEGVKLFTIPSRRQYSQAFFSDDDSQIITKTADRICVLCADSGDEVLAFPVSIPARRLRPSGDRCIVCSVQEMGVWEISTGKRMFHHSCDSFIGAVCFGYNELSIVTDISCQAMCWNLADGALLFSILTNGASAIALSPTAARLCIYSEKDKKVREYDAGTGEETSCSDAFGEPVVLFLAYKTSAVLL
jgi:WD40 repeat protein